MVQMTGFIGVILFILSISILTATHASTGDRFAFNERRAGIPTTIGSLLGTLVSGQATLGSAQLAFHFGLSAWWFTLGSGIGCFILSLMYISRMRATSSLTIVSVLLDNYGKKCAGLASVLSVTGIFISVISQIISEMALLSVMFHIRLQVAGAITVVLMTAYIVFGGAVGSGYAGLVKVILLIFSCTLGVVCILIRFGGVTAFYEGFCRLHFQSGLSEAVKVYSVRELHDRYFNLFARGFAKDGASAFSMILGVISTQSYAAAIWSAKSDKTAKRAVYLSAVIVPLIGAACIMIGLFMRTQCVTSSEADQLQRIGKAIPEGMKVIESSSQIFPLFFETYIPPLFGGICLGTLLIALVGGGAGLSFGVSTILLDDIGSYLFVGRKAGLAVRRITIVAVLTAAYGAACLLSGSMINDIGFLSMGLRGTVIFIPFTAALFDWGNGNISEKSIVWTMISGTAVLVLTRVLFPGMDLLPGAVLTELIVLFAANYTTGAKEHFAS